MTKIAIVNHHSRLNRGTAAILNTRVRALKEFIPDAEFTVYTFDPYTDYGPELRGLEGIKVKFFPPIIWMRYSPAWVLRTSLNLIRLLFYRSRLFSLVNGSHGIREYLDSDIVVSTGGDVLTEDYGSRSFRNQCANLLIGQFFDKPVVIYGETIGPFKNSLNIRLARFLFGKARLITLRDEISKSCLDELGVSGIPCYVTTDSAFLLDPAGDEEVNRLRRIEGIDKAGRPLIGISASKVISRFGFKGVKNAHEKYDQYIQIMSRLVDHLVEDLNATVVFIPHVTEYWSSDDRKVAEDIIVRVKNRQRCISIVNDYTASQLKGIIGGCDMFIGTRMHSTIASTSMYVPTVNIAYSHKAHGIMGKALGLEKYVIDIRDIEYERLEAVIDEAWNNRNAINEDLKVKIPRIKEKALFNARLVADFLKESRIKK